MDPIEYAREALERAEKATEGPWEVHEAMESAQLWFMRPWPEFKSTVGSRVYLSMGQAEKDFIAHSVADVPKLARAVIAVAELHKPVESRESRYQGPRLPDLTWTVTYCGECGPEYNRDEERMDSWPCPTVRALSDALEVES